MIAIACRLMVVHTCVFVLVGVLTLVLYVDVELVYWFLFVLLCVLIWEPCKIRDLCNFFQKTKH